MCVAGAKTGSAGCTAEEVLDDDISVDSADRRLPAIAVNICAKCVCSAVDEVGAREAAGCPAACVDVLASSPTCGAFMAEVTFVIPAGTAASCVSPERTGTERAIARSAGCVDGSRELISLQGDSLVEVTCSVSANGFAGWVCPGVTGAREAADCSIAGGGETWSS